MPCGTSIAVVGMACTFPGAPHLKRYWDNICNARSAITSVPESAWECARYASRTGPARIVTRLGGFIEEPFRFDASAHGIMPNAARAAEPDQLVALQLAADALADAGYRRDPPARTAVVLGHAGAIGSAAARYFCYLHGAEQLMLALGDLLPDLPNETAQRVLEQFVQGTRAVVEDGAGGLTPNLVAARISNRFNFLGPAYTVDAACASALVALDQACQQLRSEAVDLAISGGVHLSRGPGYWGIFSQLGALSASGCMRPFDSRADGLLIGEGAGIVVLKRLENAVRDGDRIYAVIEAVGISNDGKGRSLVAPRVEGQLLALHTAWRQSDLSPADLELLEAHGTATPAGDAAEVATLRTFFGSRSARRAALGSVKSMLGHAMPAAGAAGLIKAVLGVYHGVRPPTLHCEQPRVELEDSAFQIAAQAQEWPASMRIAGVNAFGFGGTNAHVVLRSVERLRARPGTTLTKQAALQAPALFAADSLDELRRALDRDERGTRGTLRVAVTDPTPDRLSTALRLLERRQEGGSRLGIMLTEHPLIARGGKVAIMCPGFDGYVPESTADLEALLDTPLETQAPANADFLSVAARVLATNGLYCRALLRVGLRWDAAVGHSLGDISAMLATQMLDISAVQGLTAALGETLSAPDRSIATLAVGCGAARAEQICRSIRGAEVTHDNCPSQSLVAVAQRSKANLVEACRRANVLVRELEFGWGIHSSMFERSVGPLLSTLEGLTYRTGVQPTYSATTGAMYAGDAASIREVVRRHLVSPVQFRRVVEQMYADGVRVFIQAGAGSLVSYVEETLRGRPHVAIGCARRGRTSLEQLLHVMCMCWVHGASPDFAVLVHEARKPSSGRNLIELDFAVPFARFTNDLAFGIRNLANPRVASDVRPETPQARVALSFEHTMNLLACANEDVARAAAVAAKCEQTGPRTLATPVRSARQEADFEIEITPTTWPELRDHAFYRRPDEVADSAERGWVLPMTGFLHLMGESALRLAPALKVIGFADVTARDFLPCTEGQRVRVRCQTRGHDRVHVEIGHNASGSVVLAPEYPVPPPYTAPEFQNPIPSPVNARELYADRWMFHGPAYQGVIAIATLADDGVLSRIKALPARGAFLDASAQALGLWNMQRDQSSCLPIRLKNLTLFGPLPDPGAELDCDTKIVSASPIGVQADITIHRAGVICARLERWEVRRLRSSPRLFALQRWPERTLIFDEIAPGVVFYRDEYDDALSMHLIASHYLSQGERARYDGARPSQRHSQLSARALLADAVRSWAFSRGAGPVFPIEVSLTPETETRFTALVKGENPASVSFANASGATVAVCSRLAGTVGLVETRTHGDSDRARVAAAQRALDTGAVPLDRHDDQLLIDQVWVKTAVHNGFAVAWTHDTN